MSKPKNIVITGASRGIGRATALVFVSGGHRVLALSRDKAALDDLATEASDLPGELIPCVGDIRDFSSSWVTDALGEVDILINNAGLLVNKPLAEISDEDLRLVYEVNVFAVFKMVRDLLPYYRKSAHIINIGSVGGVTGTQKFPGLSAYSSSKAAMSCLSECWQAEFADQDLCFNSLALGSVNTEMLAEAFPGYRAETSPAAMAEYIYDFALKAGEVVRGQTQVVSRSNP